jgi:K+-sensing histidine kinase KdpD
MRDPRLPAIQNPERASYIPRMQSPSLLTRIISLAILLAVAIVATLLLKVAIQVVLFLLGVLIVGSIVVFVAMKLRRAGRL